MDKRSYIQSKIMMFCLVSHFGESFYRDIVLQSKCQTVFLPRKKQQNVQWHKHISYKSSCSCIKQFLSQTKARFRIPSNFPLGDSFVCVSSLPCQIQTLVALPTSKTCHRNSNAVRPHQSWHGSFASIKEMSLL